MSATAVRTWLQRQLQSSGIQIESAALKLLARSLDEITTNLPTQDDESSDRASPERLLSALLDDVETKTDDRKLTVTFVEEFLKRWMQGNQESVVEVIDAFDVPLVQYDPIRHQWFQNKSSRSIVGDIKSKTQLYEDRFLLIQQRLKRNALFRPSKWARTGGAGEHALGPQSGTADAGTTASFRGVTSAELIELKALLGHERQRRFVCGFLTKHDEGQFFIEDLSARLPIDLSGCETADGLFTENCVVVAEGELQPSGEFRAVALGLPPAEPREESIDALQGHDTFGGRVSTPFDEEEAREDDGDRIVVLSDVHLDNPLVMDNLALVLDGFSACPTPPSAFVLMGNFQTFDANGPRSKLSKVKENFTRLGRLLKGYPKIVSESQLILVPGPKDIGTGAALPRRGIPQPLIEGLREVVPNVILSSNPCRIRFRGAELSFFRADLQQKLRGLCILPPPMPTDDVLVEDVACDVANDTKGNRHDIDARQRRHASFFFDQTCSTVIQESHMCPVPLEYQPIAWEFDHALYIYPNPHGLVLADSEPAARSIFDTCDCLNPGSLASGTFGAWNSGAREMELCDVHASAATGNDGMAEELDVADGDPMQRQDELQLEHADITGIPSDNDDTEGEAEEDDDDGDMEIEAEDDVPVLTAAEQYDAMLADDDANDDANDNDANPADKLTKGAAEAASEACRRALASHDSDGSSEDEGEAGDEEKENDVFTLPPVDDE